MKLLPFKKQKQKSKEVLVIDIGLERISAGLFNLNEGIPHLAGVGRKKFVSRDEVFNSTIEALDALAAIVENLPQKGVLGVSGGSMQTTTTLAHYDRPKEKAPINEKETQRALEHVIEKLDKSERKIFFSTVGSAIIDGEKVINPLGIKGKDAQLSCFIAEIKQRDLEVFERIVSEIDLKVEKIIPTSFTVAKYLHHKELSQALICRIGKDKSEITLLLEGEVSDIFPVDLGTNQIDLLPLSWQAAIKNVDDKSKLPSLVWLFPDHDEVELPPVKEKLKSFPWGHLGFAQTPEIELAEEVEKFAPSDFGLLALSKEGIQ